eukprot:353930-Chlamydomonas_euryale.AAC.1
MEGMKYPPLPVDLVMPPFLRSSAPLTCSLLQRRRRARKLQASKYSVRVSFHTKYLFAPASMLCIAFALLDCGPEERRRRPLGSRLRGHQGCGAAQGGNLKLGNLKFGNLKFGNLKFGNQGGDRFQNGLQM